MLTAAIPVTGIPSVAIQSAITATAELLVKLFVLQYAGDG